MENMSNLNEEEKEAIEELKLAIEQDKEELPYSEESLKNKQVILNLINKLQKENEELKQLNKKQWLLTFKNYKLDSLEQVDNDFISKDVIRDKIKEYKENIEIFKKIGKTEYIVITESKILGLEEILKEAENE